MESSHQIPSELSRVDTATMAHELNLRPSTVRKLYCLNGHVYGIRPIKLGNKLLWSVADIVAALKGGKQ